MQPTETTRAPGVGRHYSGALGDRYFEYQRGGADMVAIASLRVFGPHVGPQDTVVDFGCGPGRLLALLDAREKAGVEPNEAARGAAAAAGIRMVAATRELPEHYADAVISNHALEHTLDPLRELQDLRRVLKPGGRLVLCLPIDDWRTQRRFEADPNHHLYTWTPLLIGNLLEEAGFRVTDTHVIAYALPYYNELLHRHLSQRAFDAVCAAWARLRRQRQLVAHAVA